MKIFLTAGEDAEGKVHLLYLGRDGEHAVQALENPPKGMVTTALFKKPGWDKRRHFVQEPIAAEDLTTKGTESTKVETPPVVETPIVEPPAVAEEGQTSLTLIDGALPDEDVESAEPTDGEAPSVTGEAPVLPKKVSKKKK